MADQVIAITDHSEFDLAFVGATTSPILDTHHCLQAAKSISCLEGRHRPITQR